MKKSLTLILVVILCFGTLSAVTLNVIALGTTQLINDVPLIGQELSTSDWAACSIMTMEHYGTYGLLPTQQIQIARELGNESYYYSGIPLTLDSAFVANWQNALSSLGKLNVTSVSMALTFDTVVNDISASKPIIAIVNATTAFHAVVIVGYVDNDGTSDDQVIINDPAPTGTGLQQYMTWSAFQPLLTWQIQAFRTSPQTQKTQISIQTIETVGTLNFTIGNAQTYNAQARKWSDTAQAWQVIPNATDLTGLTGNQILSLNITESGAGNYRLFLSAAQASTWTVKVTHSNPFAEAIVADPSTLVDSTINGNIGAFGVFNSPLGFMSATDGNTFTLISTGLASDAPGSPDQFASTDFPPSGPEGDTASLNITLLVPQGANSLSFDFRFLSEEFPEWVGSEYNDFFYCYFTNSTGTYQIAFDSNGNIINVNNNFFNPDLYPIGTKYDGTTTRLTSTVNVTAGETVSLCFMVGDASDGVYDTAVFLDNVRFNSAIAPPGTTPTADVAVVKHAPNNIEQGQQMTYTINYFNIAEAAANNITIIDKLPPQVNYVWSFSGGQYFANNNTVVWNITQLVAFGGGSLTITVVVPTAVPVGTVLKNDVNITTATQESNTNNNFCTKLTTVTGGTQLPPNVGMNSTVGNSNGVPVVNWATPIQFSYQGNSSVIGVDINIHLNDGGPDLGGPMTQVPGTNWTYTVVFYPKHGTANVTYTVHLAGGVNVTLSYPVLVDPSGYVYNVLNGKRIQGATVTLQRFNVTLQQFVTVDANDIEIEPHTNPQTTDQNGGYGWNVSAGIYKVKVDMTGYYSNETTVVVPPPGTDLNIALTPIDNTLPTCGNNYDGLWHSSDFTITLTAVDASGIDAIYYTINGGATKTVAANGQPLISTEGANNVLEFWSVDNYGNTLFPHNTTSNIELDKTAPTGAISINSGASTTSSTSVTLSLTYADALSGVNQVRYSNDNTWASVVWENAAATKAWNLTSGDGTKTVYYQVRDNAGLISTFSSTITLQSPTPTPTPTPRPSPSPSPSPSPTAAPTSAPAPTPAPASTPAPTPRPTATPPTPTPPTPTVTYNTTTTISTTGVEHITETNNTGISIDINGNPGTNVTVTINVYNSNPQPSATLPEGVTLTHYITVAFNMDPNNFTQATVTIHYSPSDVQGLTSPYGIYKYIPENNSYVELFTSNDLTSQTITVTLNSPNDPLFAIGNSFTGYTSPSPSRQQLQPEEHLYSYTL